MKPTLMVATALAAVVCAGTATAARQLPQPQAPAVRLADKEKHDHNEDEHKGEKKDLGKQKIGGHVVQVTQVGDVKAGQEAVFVVTLADGPGKPKAVRGWVGVESGERSIRSMAEDEGKEYHLHHEVSKPVQPNSRLWIELETAAGRQKGSFAYKPS